VGWTSDVQASSGEMGWGSCIGCYINVEADADTGTDTGDWELGGGSGGH